MLLWASERKMITTMQMGVVEAWAEIVVLILGALGVVYFVAFPAYVFRKLTKAWKDRNKAFLYIVYFVSLIATGLTLYQILPFLPLIFFGAVIVVRLADNLRDFPKFLLTEFAKSVRAHKKLNTWVIVGSMCFGIPIVLLLVYSPLGSFLRENATQVLTTIFNGIGTLFFVGFNVMFIICIVVLIARFRAELNAFQHPTVQETNPLPPPTKICPSCGQKMVFIAESQRWYCPNENIYV
jgi:hypothetical protein